MRHGMVNRRRGWREKAMDAQYSLILYYNYSYRNHKVSIKFGLDLISAKKHLFFFPPPLPHFCIFFNIWTLQGIFFFTFFFLSVSYIPAYSLPGTFLEMIQKKENKKQQCFFFFRIYTIRAISDFLYRKKEKKKAVPIIPSFKWNHEPGAAALRCYVRNSTLVKCRPLHWRENRFKKVREKKNAFKSIYTAVDFKCSIYICTDPVKPRINIGQ